MRTPLGMRRLVVPAATWDALARRYRGHTVFHDSAWHRHLLDIHPSARVEYFEVLRGAERVGVHCALRITKLGLPIHGSPLGGTGSNYMGPLVDDGVDTADLLPALRGLLGPLRGLHMELAHYRLDGDVLAAAGFERHDGVTHLLRLPATEADAWNMMKSPARNRVRKAQQNGLTVRQAADEAVADRFFEQFIEVYAKQGMTTPFGVERPRSLFRHLAPAGRLLPLEVLHEGRVLATGLFPFDDRCIYFWGAGSWLREQHLCPNELLHWEVIRFAVERGLGAYNMCGGRSQFKDKFGGEDVPYTTYSYSALPGLSKARALYRKWHFARLKSRGPAVPVARPPKGGETPAASPLPSAADASG